MTFKNLTGGRIVKLVSREKALTVLKNIKPKYFECDLNYNGTRSTTLYYEYTKATQKGEVKMYLMVIDGLLADGGNLRIGRASAEACEEYRTKKQPIEQLHPSILKEYYEGVINDF